jgi:hypothetical protein
MDYRAVVLEDPPHSETRPSSSTTLSLDYDLVAGPCPLDARRMRSRQVPLFKLIARVRGPTQITDWPSDLLHGLIVGAPRLANEWIVFRPLFSPRNRHSTPNAHVDPPIFSPRLTATRSPRVPAVDIPRRYEAGSSCVLASIPQREPWLPLTRRRSLDSGARP